MSYRIEFTTAAARQVKKLPRQARDRLLDAIAALGANPRTGRLALSGAAWAVAGYTEQRHATGWPGAERDGRRGGLAAAWRRPGGGLAAAAEGARLRARGSARILGGKHGPHDHP